MSDVERVARALCEMHGINPDTETVGSGGALMLAGQRYRLWEYQAMIVRRVMAELGLEAS